jgi:hypothetical protein
MKYGAPELTTLTSAINAIQGIPVSKLNPGPFEGMSERETSAAYADWE